jgi:hypothetical protein
VAGVVLWIFLAVIVTGASVLSLAPEDVFERTIFQSTALRSPRFVESGDFNRDGKADLAVADTFSGGLAIYLGKGNGFFAPPAHIPVAEEANALTVGDFNGDGVQDIATVTLASHISMLLGHGDGTFLPEIPVPGVEAILFINHGDFNGDGRTDLVATGGGDLRHIVVLLGAGDGTFPIVHSLTTGLYPFSIAVGDLNEDGVQDLVVANQIETGISVLLGHGDGTFAPESRYAALSPSSVALGDFNADGHQDVAVANGTNAFEISILLGLGNGALAPKIVVDTNGGYDHRQISTGDFDRDGRLDLAVTDRGGNKVDLFRGRGDGRFDRTGSVGAGAGTACTVLGDFTGDGVADLAVVGSGIQDVAPYGDLRVLPGTGTGSFAPAERGDAGASPNAIVAADMNGDGRPDLVTANTASNDVSVLINRGSGAFDPAARYPAGIAPVSLAVSDLNEDGIPDIITVSHDAHIVSVLLGGTGGGFDPPAQFPAGNSFHSPRTLAVADLNADGAPDILVANEGYPVPPPDPHTPPRMDPGFVSVLMGIGDGTFAAQRTYSAGPDPYCVVTGDFNGDGRVDAAVTTLRSIASSSTGTFVLRGAGDGTLAVYSITNDPLTGGRSAAVGDFNGDGRQDLAVVHDSPSFPSSVAILLGNGDASFGPPVDYQTGVDSQSIVVADFDHDGNQDLAVANAFGNAVSVLLGAGDGTFGPQALYPASGPASLAVADVNGDGADDLAVASPGTSSAWIFTNRQVAGSAPHAAIATSATVECDRPGGGGVTLDGSTSTDPDSAPGTNDDIASFDWYENYGDPAQQHLGSGEALRIVLTLGAHAITLKTTDHAGQTDTASATVRVVDTTPPVLDCPAPPPAAECADGGATISLSAVAHDLCGVVTVSNDQTPGGADASGRFALGITTVSFTAMDAGGLQATCATAVTVRDTRAPSLTLHADPVILWPPNHDLVPVRVSWGAGDACNPQGVAVRLVSVTSSEPDDATGNADGATASDVQDADIGAPDTTLMLRAERDARGPGRIYTLTYSAQDASGNATSSLATVTVPHDPGQVKVLTKSTAAPPPRSGGGRRLPRSPA